MRILLMGQGEYFWRLVKESYFEHSESFFYIVSTDAVPLLDFEETVGLKILKLDFTKSEENWKNLIDLLPTNLQYLISFQFPFKIPTNFLDLFKNSAWNLHTAPLPLYGGWNGSSHAIIEDSKFFGPTLHEMTEVIDGGGIIAFDYFPLLGDETSFEISEESKKRGINLVKIFLHSLQKNFPIKIIENLNSTPRFFSKNDLEKFRVISLDEGPEKIYRVARAFSNPKFPGAIIDLGDNRKIEVKKYL